jgi:hypothetical protein
MSKVFFYLGILLVFFSCQDIPQNDKPDREVRGDSLELDKSIRAEVLANSTLQVDLYELDYDNREFPGKNGFKRTSRVIQKKVMDYFDFIALKSIVNDTNTYNTSGAACFYPNIGVVVHDGKSTILSELYICMHCNNAEVYDNNGTFTEIQRKDGKYGFSERARMKIRNLIASYGFETKHSFSISYDYLDDYLQSQIHNGRDSTEVVNEILEYNQGQEKASFNELEFPSRIGWSERSPGFFDAENIGNVVYEYDATGGDKFTCYLGELTINGSVFYVCNVFRRVQAAIVLHGHSSLFFLNSEKKVEAEYSMSYPDELPKKIIQNKLEFNIEKNTYFVDQIDFSLPYLCIAENVLCVPKK